MSYLNPGRNEEVVNPVCKCGKRVCEIEKQQNGLQHNKCICGEEFYTEIDKINYQIQGKDSRRSKSGYAPTKSGPTKRKK